MTKSLPFIILMLMAVQVVYAQPKARRVAEKSGTATSQAVTNRARISYPVATSSADDAVWRRDIYREIDLQQEANAGLYYPVEPTDKQVNLFTFMFKMILRGELKAYEYRLDGNEVFTDSARVKPKALLDNYHIYYERQSDGRIKLDNSDIPSREVKSYYLKESAYVDKASATFHKQVIALCPVMTREDDFGDGTNKYPLFWVRYADLAPLLSKQVIMTSSYNNAATMSAADYFAKNMYSGKIYKTGNMLGQPLSQYCKDDTALSKEQQRIETELQQFEQSLWGDHSKRDSLDSIAKVQSAVKGKKVKKAKLSKEEKRQLKASNGTSVSGSNSQSARVTVRRQRH